MASLTHSLALFIYSFIYFLFYFSTIYFVRNGRPPSSARSAQRGDGRRRRRSLSLYLVFSLSLSLSLPFYVPYFIMISEPFQTQSNIRRAGMFLVVLAAVVVLSYPTKFFFSLSFLVIY